MQMCKFIKQSFRYLITSVNNYHRQGGKRDILILASARSGSTWLMESFYTQPGVKYLNVPLEQLYLDFLHVLPKSRVTYTSLSPVEKRIIKDYLTKDRPIRHCGPVNIFDRDFSLFTNRRVLKIHKAIALIEWLAEENDFDIIHLIRHPIPQSISAKRHGFSNRIRAYLSDGYYVENHLNSQQQTFVEKVLNTGTDTEKYVTGWCLENLVPLKVPKNQRRWISISYEELVTRPMECFTYLGERLEFENIDRMLTRLKVPSRGSSSSLQETHMRIRKRDTAYLINKWSEVVDESEAAQAMDILELFGIYAYRHGCYFPQEEFLLFPELEQIGEY